MKIKNIILRFDEKTFKKLENAKEEAKITEDISNWEEFIIFKSLGLKELNKFKEI
jgi:hypothetical protein